jgi:hypothetical protein
LSNGTSVTQISLGFPIELLAYFLFGRSFH